MTSENFENSYFTNFRKSYFRDLHGIMIFDPVVLITLGKPKLLNNFEIKFSSAHKLLSLFLGNTLHFFMSTLKFHIWYRSQAILFVQTNFRVIKFSNGHIRRKTISYLWFFTKSYFRSSLFILYNFFILWKLYGSWKSCIFESQ